MIKFKWLMPFVPTVGLAWPMANYSMETRVLTLAGIFAYMAAFLAVIQPWQEDRPSSGRN